MALEARALGIERMDLLAHGSSTSALTQCRRMGLETAWLDGHWRPCPALNPMPRGQTTKTPKFRHCAMP